MYWDWFISLFVKNWIDGCVPSIRISGSVPGLASLPIDPSPQINNAVTPIGHDTEGRRILTTQENRKNNEIKVVSQDAWPTPKPIPE